MKEMIDTVMGFGVVELGLTAVVGLMLLGAIPFVLWRMISSLPKLLWNVSKFCAIVTIGGAVLIGTFKFIEYIDENPLVEPAPVENVESFNTSFIVE